MTIRDEIIEIGEILAHWRLSGGSKGRRRRVIKQERLTTWASIFADRYGVNGEQAARVVDVAKANGRSVDRAVAIPKLLIASKGELQLHTPLLDFLPLEIEKYLPATVDVLNEKVRELLGPKLSIRQVQLFAEEALGKHVATIVVSPFKQLAAKADVVVKADSNRLRGDAQTIVQRALLMSRITGAANIHYVTSAASEALGRTLDLQEVRAWCAIHDDFEWLDEQGGWFWFGPEPESRLYTVVRKQLVATGDRIDLVDVQAGMNVFPCEYNKVKVNDSDLFGAPGVVLGEVLSRLPWLQSIDQNTFMFTPEEAHKTEPADVLTEVEQVILELIRENQSVATRAQIHERITKLGLATEKDADKALERSPSFMKVGPGLYAVRGATLDPRGLASASSGQRSDSQAPADDGPFRWPLFLTEKVIKTRKIFLPASVAKRLKGGDYQVLDPAVPVQVQINPKLSYINGLFTPLIQAGYKQGQLLELQFDLEERTIKVVVLRSEEVGG